MLGNGWVQQVGKPFKPLASTDCQKAANCMVIHSGEEAMALIGPKYAWDDGVRVLSASLIGTLPR